MRLIVLRQLKTLTISTEERLPSVRYAMIPRKSMNFIEHEIALMANLFKRRGFGANLKALEIFEDELEITMTPLSFWFREKASSRDNQKRLSIINS